jgi:hypothetical protein
MCVGFSQAGSMAPAWEKRSNILKIPQKDLNYFCIYGKMRLEKRNA